ncbi:MAG: hypothetical protein HQK51_19390 [Oligoflexia bacterium]|nr:hypothetical protein [Oligoflexia bacterium]
MKDLNNKIINPIFFCLAPAICFLITTYVVVTNYVLGNDDVAYIRLSYNLYSKFFFSLDAVSYNLIYPPVYPALLTMFRFFISDYILITKLIIIIFSLLTLIVQYRFLKKLLSLNQQQSLCLNIMIFLIPAWMLYSIGWNEVISIPYSFLAWLGISYSYEYFQNENPRDVLISSSLFSISYLIRPEGLGFLAILGLVIVYKIFKNIRVGKFAPKDFSGIIKPIAFFIIPIIVFVLSYIIFLKTQTGIWMISMKSQAGLSHAIGTYLIDKNEWKIFLYLKVLLKNIETIPDILSSFLFINPMYYLLILLGFVYQKKEQVMLIKKAFYPVIFFAPILIFISISQIYNTRFFIPIYPVLIILVLKGFENIIYFFRRINLPKGVPEIMMIVYLVSFTLVATKRPSYTGNILELNTIGSYLKDKSIKCDELFSSNPLLLNKIFIYLGHPDYFISDEQIKNFSIEGKKYAVIDVNYNQQMMPIGKLLEDEIRNFPVLSRVKPIKTFENKIQGQLLLYKVL